MKKTREIIREGRIALGMTEEDLAKICGVSRGAVQHWERPGGTTPRRDKLDIIARTLDVTVSQLLGIADESNIKTTNIGTTQIPLISRVMAGNFREVIDAFAPGDGHDYLLTDIAVSKYAFALEIEGASMLPEFTAGDRVIIDPDIKPSPGDFVVAKNGDAATFKKYRPKGINEKGMEVFELIPLNIDYPTIRSDLVPIEIIGTMIEHRKYRRRP